VFFFSYARSDFRIADRLTEKLADGGLSSFRGSGSSADAAWHDDLLDAIGRCSVFVALLTPNSTDSEWTAREWEHATLKHRVIVPVLAQGTLPAALSGRPHEDITSGDSRQLIELLTGLAQHAPPPGPWARRYATGEPDPAKVFINYRHADSAFAAHWLHGHVSTVLSRDFGLPDNSVFIDADGIGFGIDFEDSVDEAIRQCRVMLTLIGCHWTGAVDACGRPRLDNPDDPVRHEIELALKFGVTIVPVLLEPASMPHAEDLPESIRAITRLHAATLRAAHFEADAGQLARELGYILRT
jgi:hypothetical protein